LKAFRAHRAFNDEVDRDALALFLRHTHIPAPYTVFRHARKLPPATVMTVDLESSPEAVAPRPYWSDMEAALVGAASPAKGPVTDLLDELEALIEDSIALRMVADVPYGALLSGGVDSSLVVALMQRQTSKRVRTFTVGFHEAKFDEAKYARAVASHLGTDHNELYLRPEDALSIIPHLPEIYDEPFADSSQIPTYLIAELARRHVKVCLSGDGGDELFAGYARYTSRAGVQGAISRAPQPLRRILAAFLFRVAPAQWDRLISSVAPLRPQLLGQRSVGDKVHRLAESLSSPSPDDAYVRLMSQWQDPTTVVVGSTEPPTLFTKPDPALARLSPVARMSYLDQVAYLPDDLLTKLDRATMAVSLEGRVPMLDHRLVEFAWRWPHDLKVRKGVGKWPLRTLLRRYLPSDLVDRPKAGFSVPVAQWLRAPLREWSEELLDAHRLRQDGYLEATVVRRAWLEHLSGERNREHQLWAVLMFQAWLDAWRTTSATPSGASPGRSNRSDLPSWRS